MMLALYGPTATGKTDLAISLAKKLSGEIISADSRQIYKGLDIGTGKFVPLGIVEKGEGWWKVSGVTIHGYDLKKPGEIFSVVDFIDFASKVSRKIKKRSRLPIITGGSGFYIHSFINRQVLTATPPDFGLRKKLEKFSPFELLYKLSVLNRQKAKVLNESDRKNPRRLIRAIEIELNKSENYVNNGERDENILVIGLTGPNDKLFQKADNWLEYRFAHGMIDEVQNLLNSGVKRQWLEALGLEYKWSTRFAKNEIGFRQMAERLKGDIHAYIRRQKTWFKKFPGIILFDISKPYLPSLERTVRKWYAEKKTD